MLQNVHQLVTNIIWSDGGVFGAQHLLLKTATYYTWKENWWEWTKTVLAKKDLWGKAELSDIPLWVCHYGNCFTLRIEFELFVDVKLWIIKNLNELSKDIEVFLK